MDFYFWVNYPFNVMAFVKMLLSFLHNIERRFHFRLSSTVDYFLLTFYLHLDAIAVDLGRLFIFFALKLEISSSGPNTTGQ